MLKDTVKQRSRSLKVRAFLARNDSFCIGHKINDMNKIRKYLSR